MARQTSAKTAHTVSGGINARFAESPSTASRAVGVSLDLT